MIYSRQYFLYIFACSIYGSAALTLIFRTPNSWKCCFYILHAISMTIQSLSRSLTMILTGNKANYLFRQSVPVGAGPCSGPVNFLIITGCCKCRANIVQISPTLDKKNVGPRFNKNTVPYNLVFLFNVGQEFFLCNVAPAVAATNYYWKINRSKIKSDAQMILHWVFSCAMLSGVSWTTLQKDFTGAMLFHEY